MHLNDRPIQISSEKIILVEGDDEINFFDAFLRHLELKDIQLMDFKGKDNLKNIILEFVDNSNFNLVKSYCIIRDADKSAKSAFQSVADLLKKYKQPCPKKNAQFAHSEKLKVGVYIVSDHFGKGMLEGLCLATVKDHPIMPCVDDLFTCFKSKLVGKTPEKPHSKKNHFYPKNESKAKSLAFLSGMYEPANSIGIAAQQNCWNFDHESLSELKKFLEELAR